MNTNNHNTKQIIPFHGVFFIKIMSPLIFAMFVFDVVGASDS